MSCATLTRGWALRMKASKVSVSGLCWIHGIATSDVINWGSGAFRENEGGTAARSRVELRCRVVVVARV